MPFEREIICSDGYPLSITCYKAPEPKGSVIIAAALGVSQNYYKHFAKFLSERNYNVITFDYRGTGKSLNKERSAGLNLEDWGAKDIEAVIKFSKSEEIPIYFIGHSIGGQVLGLAPSSKNLAKILLVAASAPYWKRWEGPIKYKILFASKVLFPLISSITTRFPTKPLGLGNIDIPSSVAKQWSEWMTSPNYLFDKRFGLNTNIYQVLNQNILSIGFEDDSLAPAINIKYLLDFFPNSERSCRIISSDYLKNESIGHTGFFREKFKSSLWKDTVSWMENDRF